MFVPFFLVFLTNKNDRNKSVRVTEVKFYFLIIVSTYHWLPCLKKFLYSLSVGSVRFQHYFLPLFSTWIFIKRFKRAIVIRILFTLFYLDSWSFIFKLVLGMPVIYRNQLLFVIFDHIFLEGFTPTVYPITMIM